MGNGGPFFGWLDLVIYVGEFVVCVENDLPGIPWVKDRTHWKVIGFQEVGWESVGVSL